MPQSLCRISAHELSSHHSTRRVTAHVQHMACLHHANKRTLKSFTDPGVPVRCAITAAGSKVNMQNHNEARCHP